MDTANRQPLSAPMLQSSLPGTENSDVDRCPAMMSTTTNELSTRLLVDSLVGGANASRRGPGEEADAAAGGALPSRPGPKKLSGFVLAAIIYFNSAGEPVQFKLAIYVGPNLILPWFVCGLVRWTFWRRTFIESGGEFVRHHRACCHALLVGAAGSGDDVPAIGPIPLC